MGLSAESRRLLRQDILAATQSAFDDLRRDIRAKSRKRKGKSRTFGYQRPSHQRRVLRGDRLKQIRQIARKAAIEEQNKQALNSRRVQKAIAQDAAQEAIRKLRNR